MTNLGGKEIEIQIINQNIDEFRKLLDSHGGCKQIHPYETLRASYIYLDDGTAFLRLRDEIDDGGSKCITLTYKKFTTDYAYESEFKGCPMMKNEQMMESISGDREIIHVERRREKWKCANENIFEISFDEWPGIPPYIEIEGPNELEIFLFLRNLLGRGTKIQYFIGGAFDIYEWKHKIKREYLKTNSLTFDDIDEFIHTHGDTGTGIIETLTKNLNGDVIKNE